MVRKAAAQGEPNGQYNLGVAYENGAGVQQDYDEALRWYRLAADQGNACAQNAIGLFYDFGHAVRAGQGGGAALVPAGRR